MEAAFAELGSASRFNVGGHICGSKTEPCARLSRCNYDVGQIPWLYDLSLC